MSACACLINSGRTDQANSSVFPLLIISPVLQNANLPTVTLDAMIIQTVLRV